MPPSAARSDVNGLQQTDMLRAQERKNLLLRKMEGMHDERGSTATAPDREQHAVPAPATVQQCTDSRSVHVSGLDLLALPEQMEIRRMIPPCVSQGQVDALTQAITAAFVRRGYPRIAIRPLWLPQQLELVVEPVRIAKVTGQTRQVNPSTLFPQRGQGWLNMQDLDQALDQTRRLPGLQVQADVYPQGSDAVEVRLTSRDAGVVHGSISLDNTGSSSTGRGVVRGTLSVNSPLGLSDSLWVSANSTWPGTSQQKSHGATLLYAVPYGYWNFSAMASASAYKAQQPLQGVNAELAGSMRQYAVRADRVVSRSARHITSLYLQLAKSDVRNTFMGTELAIQSPSILKSQLGLSHTRLFEAGVAQWGLEWQKGLREQAQGNMPASLFAAYPHAAFDKVLFTASWNGQFQALDKNWSHQHQLVAQHARQPLYGVEQMLLSDRTLVRGLADTNVSGDRGWAVRNTLATTWAVGNWTVQPRIGLDAGVVRSSTASSASTERVVSGSAGFGLKYRNLAADLELARARLLVARQTRNSLTASVTWTF
ncbi:MAG: ShlB/FhaC/HecB family hemolysin secretion/activation protein [Brachymonas sp.]|nr:ShlB/FhaC/HecB family hemolysin secretion/activation protein [Brachymonas sp.]